MEPLQQKWQTIKNKVKRRKTGGRSGLATQKNVIGFELANKFKPGERNVVFAKRSLGKKRSAYRRLKKRIFILNKVKTKISHNLTEKDLTPEERDILENNELEKLLKEQKQIEEKLQQILNLYNICRWWDSADITTRKKYLIYMYVLKKSMFEFSQENTGRGTIKLYYW